MPGKHQVSVEPEQRSGGRYTYNLRCSCGHYRYGCSSRGAAQAEGRQHQSQEK